MIKCTLFQNGESRTLQLLGTVNLLSPKTWPYNVLAIETLKVSKLCKIALSCELSLFSF